MLLLDVLAEKVDDFSRKLRGLQFEPKVRQREFEAFDAFGEQVHGSAEEANSWCVGLIDTETSITRVANKIL